MRYTIQSIHKVFDTGDKPVLVFCDDLEFYVCKHNQGNTNANKLFCELISLELLQALNISVPAYDFIQVKEEHIIAQSNCQPAFFKNKTSFGTKNLHEALEFSQFLIENYKHISNKKDLIMIAFFDLWFCNEDRNFNNFNLLLNPIDSGFEVMPIDHGACFNSLSFKDTFRLASLFENESIIDTIQFKKIVKGLLKTAKEAENFANLVYLSFPELKKVYENTVLKIPEDWNISPTFIEALKQQLFSETWFHETKMTFISYLKVALKIK